MLAVIEQLETFLCWSAIAAYLILIVKLFKIGLNLRYRFFVIYLISNVVGLVCLQLFSWPGKQYFHFWVIFQTVNWTLAAMMVIELMTLILSEYPGLRITGKACLSGSIVLAMLASVATLGIDFPTEVFSQKAIAIAAVVHRVILFNLVIFQFLMLIGLSWFPIRLSSNLKIHSGLLFGLLLCEGLANLFRNREGGQWNVALTGGLFLVTILALTTWSLKMSVEGELRGSTRPSLVPSGRERMLLLQMRAIDEALLRSLRK